MKARSKSYRHDHVHDPIRHRGDLSSECQSLTRGVWLRATKPRPAQHSANSPAKQLPAAPAALAASLANPDQRFEFREEHGARSLSKKGARASPRPDGVISGIIPGSRVYFTAACPPAWLAS